MKIFNFKSYRWAYITLPIIICLVLLFYPVFMSAKFNEEEIADVFQENAVPASGTY